MNILMLCPKYPDTYWSFKHALKFISKKASLPPLGLLTVASMLPDSWQIKLVDLNVKPLQDTDIIGADFVFISAMSVQADSVAIIIERCRKLGTKIVAGGPLFTGDPDSYSDLDHLILNEAEITLPRFLADLESNNLRQIYRTDDFAEMINSPEPDYSLIKVSDYAQLSIQYSRGCPYSCEFCEITALLGHRVRIKTTGQILNELETIFNTGFRGNVFFVDDNFIGNRNKLKKSLLPAISQWTRKHKYPFTFTTEASIDLSDDPELMKWMVAAGFDKVFVGIETPDVDSLKECNKNLNIRNDLMKSVHKIQLAGIEVSAGFIVGFDHDTDSIFQRQIDFIQESGIITAMVGLLIAPSRTKLYQRLNREGRILQTSDGNNTNFTMNFVPKMDKESLIKGYGHIVNTIYSHKFYYKRLTGFLRHFKPGAKVKTRVSWEKIMALLRSVILIGVLNKGRFHFWKLFIWSLTTRPRLFPLAITYSIYGYHFRKVYGVNSLKIS